MTTNSVKVDITTDDINNKSNENSGNLGIWATTFNLVNSMLGLGTFGMPNTLQRSGLALGVTVFLFFSTCLHYTSVILVTTANKVGVNSYEELIRKILGKPGYLMFCVFCIVSCVGAVVK